MLPSESDQVSKLFSNSERTCVTYYECSNEVCLSQRLNSRRNSAAENSWKWVPQHCMLWMPMWRRATRRSQYPFKVAVYWRCRKSKVKVDLAFPFAGVLSYAEREPHVQVSDAIFPINCMGRTYRLIWKDQVGSIDYVQYFSYPYWGQYPLKSLSVSVLQQPAPPEIVSNQSSSLMGDLYRLSNSAGRSFTRLSLSSRSCAAL